MVSIRNNMREIKNNADLAEQKENLLYQTIREKEKSIELLTAENDVSRHEMSVAIQRAAKADKREQRSVITYSLIIVFLLVAITYMSFSYVG